MPESLQQLEARRRQILAQLSVPRDLRRGSISETYRRCGKSGCWCSQSGQAGHGPFYAFTTKVDGKTQTVQLRPGPELIKLEENLLDMASKLPGRVAIESRQELYEKIINAGIFRRYLQGIAENDVIRDLRRHGEKLKEAGGPANPGLYGPKFKKVFDSL